MARIGVTYYEVADTADALKAQGLNPTVDRIIGVLGTGSRTTINNHLRTWKSQIDAARKQDVMKESLGSVLSQKAADIYEALEAEATQKFESLIEGQQQEISKIKEELADVVKEKESLLGALDQSRAANKELELQLTSAKARSAELEQVLQDCRLSLSEANTRISDLRAHIASLKETEVQTLARVENSTEQIKNLTHMLRDSLREHDQFAIIVSQGLDASRSQNEEMHRLLVALNENLISQRVPTAIARPFARSGKLVRSRSGRE